MAERSEGKTHTPACRFYHVPEASTEFATWRHPKPGAPEISAGILEGGNGPRVVMGLTKRSGWIQT